MLSTKKNLVPRLKNGYTLSENSEPVQVRTLPYLLKNFNVSIQRRLIKNVTNRIGNFHDDEMEKFQKEPTRWPEENYAKSRCYGWSKVRDSNTRLPHYEAELLFIHSINQSIKI